MRCPYCGADDSRVVDSRTGEGSIRRRRECSGCGSRFTTHERVESAGVLVVKRDGRREAFAREKLLAGVRRACDKRPLAAGAVEALVAAVEREVFAQCAAEVCSSFIGECTMERLKDLDQIAYVRFASVYRHFADVESLRAMLDDLDAARRRMPPGGWSGRHPGGDTDEHGADAHRFVARPALAGAKPELSVGD